MCIMSVIDLCLFQFNIIETKGKTLSDNMPVKELKFFSRKQYYDVELVPENSKFEDVNKPLSNSQEKVESNGV